MTNAQLQKETEMERTRVMSAMRGKWASRWIWAAVIQGAIIATITVLIVEPWTYFNISSYFSPSRVIAGGGGGVWMFTGYILYLTVGVIAVAVTAIFYFYIEGVTGKVYHGLTNYLAWGHYLLMNIGVAGAMMLMIWGGYMAGYAGTAVAAGGLGLTDEQIHVQYLGQLVNPIGALVLLATFGAVLGGLGFIMRSRAPGYGLSTATK
jgi:hypothetical protein